MAIVAVLSLFPHLLFSGSAKTSQVASLGILFVEAEFTPLGNACFAGFFFVFAHLISMYARHRDRIGPSPRPIFISLCLWFLCGFNDIAVTTDLYEGPFLMAPGFVAFTIAFTAILVHRFVVSVEQVEQSAETLHKLVEQRSEELRQKDLQLAHGERMATLGTLAASVAHEINNPIAFIASNLGHLESIWKQDQGQQEVEEILAETREGVDRIRVIVSELLTLARRSDGIDERVNLCSVVESVIPILNHVARHRAAIRTELNPVPDVLGDERLMGQIVLNLALNAIQAIPEGHRDENRVTISTVYEDGSVWLMTRDTGPGISEDVLPHIFDPFFTTKDKGEGTGLGLAVTHQLVTRYRGRVDVETSATGTTITVELPPVTDPAS
jgi:signal transduction histidine kinase